MSSFTNRTFTIIKPEDRIPYKTLIKGEELRRQIDSQINSTSSTNRVLRGIEKEKENQEKQTEFLKQFSHHPLSEEMVTKLKSIHPSNYRRTKPIYILDKDKNILAFVTKSEIPTWGRNNGYKTNQIVDVVNYRENPSDDKLMYVSIYDYDEFIDTVVYV